MLHTHQFGLFKLVIQAYLILCVTCITTLSRSCTFYKLKVCGNPLLSKSISAIFSSCSCSLHVCVSHFDHFHSTSNFLIIILLVMVICINDLWCYYGNCFRGTTNCALQTGLSLCLSLCRACSLRQKNIEIRRINNLTQWLLSVQVRWRVTCLSF